MKNTYPPTPKIINIPPTGEVKGDSEQIIERKMETVTFTELCNRPIHSVKTGKPIRRYAKRGKLALRRKGREDKCRSCLIQKKRKENGYSCIENGCFYEGREK